MRTSIFLAAVLGLLVAGVAIAGQVGPRQTSVFQVRKDQTTANTKVIEAKNAAGSTVASIDIEGDAAFRNLAVTGTFTLPATDFASGLTTTTATATGLVSANAGVCVDSPAWCVANTTGAMTTTGVAALNGGITVDSTNFIVDGTSGAVTAASTMDVAGALGANGGLSVDSPAWAVANTTGAMTTTGLASLNGGIAVDANFTVDGTSGAIVGGSTLTMTGAIAANGGITGTSAVMTGNVVGTKVVVLASSGSTQLTVAQSGGLVANQGTGGTTTFVLPAAAAGLNYCFSELGDAAGELLINPTAGDAIVGKIHAANDGTGLAPAAGTGIKNTAGTNVKGDWACLTAIDGTTWAMTSQGGVWASQ